MFDLCGAGPHEVRKLFASVDRCWRWPGDAIAIDVDPDHPFIEGMD